jgi:hypothetical protein
MPKLEQITIFVTLQERASAVNAEPLVKPWIGRLVLYQVEKDSRNVVAIMATSATR